MVWACFASSGSEWFTITGSERFMWREPPKKHLHPRAASAVTPDTEVTFFSFLFSFHGNVIFHNFPWSKKKRSIISVKEYLRMVSWTTENFDESMYVQWKNRAVSIISLTSPTPLLSWGRIWRTPTHNFSDNWSLSISICLFF